MGITGNIITQNRNNALLESLITSKTRIKLLLKFFINPGTRAYLREIAKEFDESSNAVRVELNRLTDAKLLVSESAGRTIQYRANKNHSLFKDIESVVKKYVGLDQLVENLINELGDIRAAYIIGDYSKGIDSGLIDLVLVGELDEAELNRLVKKTEGLIKRKIRTLTLKVDELDGLKDHLNIENALLLWVKAPKIVVN
jgi:hypothetical protein